MERELKWFLTSISYRIIGNYKEIKGETAVVGIIWNRRNLANSPILARRSPTKVKNYLSFIYLTLLFTILFTMILCNTLPYSLNKLLKLLHYIRFKLNIRLSTYFILQFMKFILTSPSIPKFHLIHQLLSEIHFNNLESFISSYCNYLWYLQELVPSLFSYSTFNIIDKKGKERTLKLHSFHSYLTDYLVLYHLMKTYNELSSPLINKLGVERGMVAGIEPFSSHCTLSFDISKYFDSIEMHRFKCILTKWFSKKPIIGEIYTRHRDILRDDSLRFGSSIGCLIGSLINDELLTEVNRRIGAHQWYNYIDDSFCIMNGSASKVDIINSIQEVYIEHGLKTHEFSNNTWSKFTKWNSMLFYSSKSFSVKWDELNQHYKVMLSLSRLNESKIYHLIKRRTVLGAADK